MGTKTRTLIGVIAAQVSDIEQQQILQGIIKQAQSYNIDIAVFSNIYNPKEPDPAINCENDIYDLILSSELDGLILISEAIINIELQQSIKHKILKQSHIPIIVIGTPILDFMLPNFEFVNTSDENDAEEITNHLIEVHGFKNIDMITGYRELDASNLRINGYRKSLEKHNIEFDFQKVHFGDFWMSSGKKLAEHYISGEVAMPEAIICANDYMAYGLLDEFLEHNVKVPEDITVIGYEYIRDRLYHSPILTTYQRNRKDIGKEAVKSLFEKINGRTYNIVALPKGKIIYGDTCTCGMQTEQFCQELKSARTKQTYDILNLFSQLEHRLTECRSTHDFIKVCGNFNYLIRNVNKTFLCLNEYWYDNSSKSDMMNCYQVDAQSHDSPIIHFNKYAFSEIISNSDKASAYYFNPLFFSERVLGYVILKYDCPDTYDHISRNWLKTISNGLEFLRMKNDIQYLMQCQSSSEDHDYLTGLYNEKGFQKEFCSITAERKSSLYCILLKICLFSDVISLKKKETNITATLEIAENLKQLCKNHGFCGKISNNTFSGIISCNKNTIDFITDRWNAILTHKETYIKSYGIDSFVYCTINCSTLSYSEMIKKGSKLLEEKIKFIAYQRKFTHYSTLIKIRNQIYIEPEKLYSAEKIYNEYGLSYGHFRTLYKKCFGISFHQDYINSRISMAKYLLSTTSLTTLSIAEHCGYDDYKYFLRQFLKRTGHTPNKYRNTLT